MFTKGLLIVGSSIRGLSKGGGIGTLMEGLVSVGSSITKRFILGWSIGIGMFKKGLLSVGSSIKDLSKGGGIGIGYRHVYERFIECR